ncbi:MAG: aminotransferase class I/II-fold pyridoxal phosphate-dependent enzyme, partial [Candidatus Lokiarchaeota archaeon]|nr:aminotransferase class I/II-fold pyridoxal phosphate-dependent enzyme [Candidatus Lokiarchaeota archaeon]
MLVRLDRNEMAIKLPKVITDPIKESIEFLNRYTPQSKVDELLSLLSTYTNSPKNSIIISSASDILLKEFIYLFSKNRQIILADPSFFLINATCKKIYSSILKVRLKEPEFKFSIVPLIDELKKPTLIILDNPNNPTGNIILDKNEVKLILENENIIFLVDEAYFEFSNVSCANLIADYPNL